MIQQEAAQQLTLSSEEISIIHRFISEWELEGMPSEEFFQEVVDAIANEVHTERSIEQIAIYVESYLANQMKQQVSPQPQFQKPILVHKPKIQNLELKSNSIFKQFADFSSVKPQECASFKNIGNYINRSKRKIKPIDNFPIPNNKSIEDIVYLIDSSTNDCNFIFEKKNKKGSTLRQIGGTLHESCQWIYNQYFYSNYDRAYFKEEDSPRKLFSELRLDSDKLSYRDHRIIRRALPKPKLFNSQFINLQLDKLFQFRTQIRNYPKNRAKGQFDLTVGKQVIALHPACGHLHSGNILAIYKQNQYMVKFTRPELGTQKILDINMLLKENNDPQRVIFENIDHEVMALTIKLLEYKSQLISTLKEYNNNAQSMNKQQESLDNRFLQEYGWIGSTINVLTLGIKHIISKFRMRGINQTSSFKIILDQEKVGKNFASLLLNPLNIMERQLDKSSQNSDINASQQIKKIVSNYRQNKSAQYAQQLFDKNISMLRESISNPEQRKEKEKLLKSAVGLLVNLKYEIRNFNIEKNRFVYDIEMQIDQQYPQYFNQIYETLHTIATKANQTSK